MRDLVDLGADALLDVGGAVDHRVEQIHQHRFARHLGRAGARQFVLDDGERPRLVVAHGDQAVAERMKVTGVVFGVTVSDWHISVAVM